MAVNPYFKTQSYFNEQDLVDRMKAEAIQIKGMDVMYIVRDMVDRDYLYGESKISDFKDYIDIEMYLESIQNNGMSSLLMEKFGAIMSDQAVFEVHARRFVEEAELFNLDRPREGDLIYLREADQLYEIKRVAKPEEFYQLGVCFTYKLTCSLFVYSHEELPTGPDDELGGISLKTLLGEDDVSEPFNDLNDVSSELAEEIEVANITVPRNTRQ